MSFETTSSFSSSGSESAGSERPSFAAGSTTDSSLPLCEETTPSAKTCSPGSESSASVSGLLQASPLGQLHIELAHDVRQCAACRRTLPVECFSLHRSCSGASEQYRNRRCNQCRARRAAGSPAVLRKSAIVEAAKSRPCADCGRTFPTACMDLDHVRGKKSFVIGTAWRWLPEEKLVAEIAKCDVVCACCHRLRTKARPQPKRGRPPRDLARARGKLDRRGATSGRVPTYTDEPRA